MAETPRFVAEKVYGALGPRTSVMWQTALTPYALKDDYSQREYAEKPLNEKQLKNSLRKLLDQQ